MTRVLFGCGLLGLFTSGFFVLDRAPAAAATAAKERDAFFKGSKVLHLKIEIGKKEVESLRREPRKYVKATLKEGDKAYTDVGIHVKGAAGKLARHRRQAGPHPQHGQVQEGSTLPRHGQVPPRQLGAGPKLPFGTHLRRNDRRRRACRRRALATQSSPSTAVRAGFITSRKATTPASCKKHFGRASGNFYDGGFLRDIDQPLDLIHQEGRGGPRRPEGARRRRARAGPRTSASRDSTSCSISTSSSATWSSRRSPGTGMATLQVQ